RTIGYTASGEVGVVGVVSRLSPPRDPLRYGSRVAMRHADMTDDSSSGVLQSSLFGRVSNDGKRCRWHSLPIVNETDFLPIVNA
ncbi:MAG: hypothetical protein AAF802_29695, partial [Planctomycetota bacterium]